MHRVPQQTLMSIARSFRAWLLFLQTPKKLLTHLQDGLPDPRTVSCSDVSATPEVLLLHGLSANCTVKCTAQGGPPTATDAGTEHSLLEW